MKELTVNDFMKKSGIPMHLKGYEILSKCIELGVDNPDMTVSEMYEKIYIESKCSHWSVDRNIRTAIRKGYPYMDEKIKNTLFQTVKDVPPSGEFIKTVSYAIRKDVI